MKLFKNNLIDQKDYFRNSFLKKIEENIHYKENKNWPKISIVMPSFNQEKFIEQSILSILNQSYPNLQLIIIDGGSNDRTVEIIKKYQKYIDFWISEPDQGQSDALNKGFKKANGEIFGWMNSDDLYLPNAFFFLIDAFKKNPNKEIIFGDWLTINRKSNILDLNHAFDFNLNHFKYEGFHINSQSMLWRATLHQQFNGFDLNLYNTMDYQMILEFGLLMEKKFLRISRVIGAFRRYEGQKTGAEISPDMVREHYYMANKFNYKDKYFFIGKLKRHLYRYRRAYWYVKRGGFKNLFKRLMISLKFKGNIN